MDIVFHPEETKKLHCIKLRDPKTGELRDYFYDEENLTLSEITRFSDDYRSWFIDDMLISDSSLLIFTKVDPLFILIPYLKKYSRSFRSLSDICLESADEDTDKLEFALSPSIDWTLICDTQEQESELYVRLSEDKMFSWLTEKYDKLFGTLAKTPSFRVASRHTIASCAYDLIGEYLEEEIFSKFKDKIRVKLTSDSTKLDVTDERPRTQKRKSLGGTSTELPRKAPLNSNRKEPPKTGLFKYFSPRGT